MNVIYVLCVLESNLRSYTVASCIWYHIILVVISISGQHIVVRVLLQYFVKRLGTCNLFSYDL